MAVLQFLQDKKTHEVSATRIGFLLWVVGLFGVWAYASVRAGALQSVPESVTTILGLLTGGKVVQRFAEK